MTSMTAKEWSDLHYKDTDGVWRVRGAKSVETLGILNSSPDAPAVRYDSSFKRVSCRSPEPESTESEEAAEHDDELDTRTAADRAADHAAHESARKLVAKMRKESGGKQPSAFNALQFALTGTFMLRSQVQKLADRVKELERREQKTLADAYQGAWLPQRLYRRGALVLHNSCAWIALADTEGVPGQNAGWRLLLRGAR